MNTGGDDTPIVSVVLATNVLNDWVDLAVRSMLDQEGLAFEVIVVHDQIDVDNRRAWAADGRVRCVTTGTSSGLANALTVGVGVAQGRYLARLDGDDVAMPGRLKVQLAYLEAHPEVVLVGTAARTINDEGEPQGHLGISVEGDARGLLLMRNVLTHSSVMMRREAYDAAGGYDRSLRQMEDYALWLSLARQGEVHVLPEELTEYRVHAQQMSRGAASSGPHIDAVIRGRRALADHLGQRRGSQVLRDVAWKGAQVARYRGWRRPGYARATTQR